MKEIVIFNKRGRMIVLSFLAFAFVACGFVFIGFSGNEDIPIWYRIIGFISVFFFGFCGLYSLKEIFLREPALLITDEGITDRSSFIGAGLIEWKDINSIELIRFSNQLFLGIYTHDPKLIINRTYGIKKVLNQMNRGLIASQVNIPVKNLAYPREELVTEMNKRLAEQKESVTT